MNHAAHDPRDGGPAASTKRIVAALSFLPEAPQPLAVALKVSLLALLVMFPVGMALMLAGLLTNQTLWTTSVFLAVQFLVTLIYYISVARAVPALVATGALLALAILIEFVGVTTGYPFGRYYYSYFLEPFVIGNVPLAISFAWFALVVNSYLAVVFLSGSQENSLTAVVLSAILVLGIDMALEPFAALVNRYWTWVDGSIPLTNFAAWAGLALLFAFVLSRFTILKSTVRSARLAAIPLMVLGLNMLQFTVINLVNGYWLLTACGLAVIGGVLAVSVRRGSRAH